MGIFDFLKKKEKSDAKCVKCFKKINEPIFAKYWKINGKQYCQDCYTQKITIDRQQGSGSPESYDFTMPVDEVFTVKDRGIVLTGIISYGVVHYGDIVTINNNRYKVIGIDKSHKLADTAKEGDSIGLLIEAFNPAEFHKGDIVSAKLGAEKIKNTFVCAACKQELPIKYCYKNNICAKCYETAQREGKDNPEPKKLYLGSFSFSDDDRQKMKAFCMQYMPQTLETVDAQLDLLEALSAVMDITTVKLKTEFLWKFPDGMPEETKKQRLHSALAETIFAVNHTLDTANTDFLIKKVNDATLHELFKAWIVLDYYAYLLKPEYNASIQHFRDYIHNIILQSKIKINENLLPPVKYENMTIHIDSKAFFDWKNANPHAPQFELSGILPLTEKEPVIGLYEDGVKTREYCLQTEGEEDFSGKFFLISVRLGMQGDPCVPVAQIDGFISDTPEERKMTTSDIGYRMEGHFLACGGESAKLRREINRGQDLQMKALKYAGYTTPANVRLVGICPDCGKSFAFHGYAFYMAQSDVAYSDDGLDCCEISAHDIDKDSWSYEADGKTFRYYNSFNCPHCGSPYIDYKKHPQNKVFGVSGCVHLGKKAYKAE